MAKRTISTSIQLDGEAEFKRQMSSVNSELRTLKSEMSLVDAEFKGQANTMEALSAKDKVLRQEIEQQTEKVKALERAVADASAAYGDSDKRTDGYRQQLNNAKASLINMNHQLEDNAKYLDEAAKSADGTASSIDGYGKEVEKADSKTEMFVEMLKANIAGRIIVDGAEALVGALKDMPAALLQQSAEALKSLVVGIKDATVASAAYADEILTQSTVTGLSTEALQEYRYMSELTDVSVDTITGSLTKLTKNMASAKDGNGSAAKAFAELGISVMDADGALRSNQEVFGEVIDKLAQMENETERDAYSMNIFGKSAQDLNPLMSQGADGIAALAAEAHEMGYVLDGETLDSLGKVDDAVQRFEKALESAKNMAGAEFAPAMEEVFNGVTQILSGDVDAGLESIERGLQLFDEKINELGPYAEEALEKFLATFADHMPELMQTGVRLLLTLIAGIAKSAPELIPAAVETIQQLVDALWDNRDLIVDAGANIVRGLWDGIKSMATWIGDKVKGFGQGVVDNLKEKLGIHSPSTVMRDQVGRYLAEGLGLGFVMEMDSVADRMADAIPSNFEVAASLNQDIRTTRSVTPMDLQSATAAAVNAMAANADEGMPIRASIKLVTTDGTELARWLLPDLRAAMKSTPEAEDDA